jgi:hypothetical protein
MVDIDTVEIERRMKLFGDHVLTEISPPNGLTGRWLFAKPGSSAYHVDIIETRSGLIVSGDVPSVPVQLRGKGMRWFVGELSFDYLIGKMPREQAEEWDATTAQKALDELITEASMGHDDGEGGTYIEEPDWLAALQEVAQLEPAQFEGQHGYYEHCSDVMQRHGFSDWYETGLALMSASCEALWVCAIQREVASRWEQVKHQEKDVKVGESTSLPDITPYVEPGMYFRCYECVRLTPQSCWPHPTDAGCEACFDDGSDPYIGEKICIEACMTTSDKNRGDYIHGTNALEIEES